MMPDRAALRQWWNSLHPTQREIRWMMVFSALGVTAIAVAVLLILLFWPQVLMNPTSLAIGFISCLLGGTLSALGGQLLGHRIEDRHQVKHDGPYRRDRLR
jgi:peptidoglycan biosynthesis protein MviN/MurJ (putative lipid II flippase)